MAVLTAASNVPLVFHDLLSSAIRNSFTDSKIASKYHSASTKATCMLNVAVTPALVEDFLESMRVRPYSLSVDGSNDTGLLKMNPITVKIYDINCSWIVTQFLNMDSKLVNLLECANPWE